jgi:MFS family permease
MTMYFPLHAETLGYTGAEAGMMFSVFALVAVLAMATPLSRISDRRGRLLPVMAGLGAVILSLALLPLMDLLPPLAVATPLWALYGLGFGLVFPAANAAVVDVTGVERRGRGFALFYIAFSLGVISGSTLAGVWSGTALGELLPLYSAGALLVFASAAVSFVVAPQRKGGHGFGL